MFDIEDNYKTTGQDDLLYSMHETAVLIGNTKAGRNTILKIMRLEGILDEKNNLIMSYSDSKFFFQDKSIGYDPFRRRIYHPIRCTSEGIELINKLLHKHYPTKNNKPKNSENAEELNPWA